MSNLFFVRIFQGGDGADSEMCLSGLAYYPKLNLTRCLSSYEPALEMFYKQAHVE